MGEASEEDWRLAFGVSCLVFNIARWNWFLFFCLAFGSSSLVCWNMMGGGG